MTKKPFKLLLSMMRIFKRKEGCLCVTIYKIACDDNYLRRPFADDLTQLLLKNSSADLYELASNAQWNNFFITIFQVYTVYIIASTYQHCHWKRRCSFARYLTCCKCTQDFWLLWWLSHLVNCKIQVTSNPKSIKRQNAVDENQKINHYDYQNCKVNKSLIQIILGVL